MFSYYSTLELTKVESEKKIIACNCKKQWKISVFWIWRSVTFQLLEAQELFCLIWKILFLALKDLIGCLKNDIQFRLYHILLKILVYPTKWPYGLDSVLFAENGIKCRNQYNTPTKRICSVIQACFKELIFRDADP